MGDDHFPIFEVDKARYITFEVLKKSLDPEVMKRIKSISSITAKSSASGKNEMYLWWHVLTLFYMFYSASGNIKNMIILATFISDGFGMYVYHQHYSNALVGACYSPHQSGPVECFPNGVAKALLAIICIRGANMAAFAAIWYAFWRERKAGLLGKRDFLPGISGSMDGLVR